MDNAGALVYSSTDISEVKTEINLRLLEPQRVYEAHCWATVGLKQSPSRLLITSLIVVSCLYGADVKNNVKGKADVGV